MTPATDTLPLRYAPADMDELSLVNEIYDSTMIINMGETGIAKHMAIDLHRSRLEAVRELARRWAVAP